MGYFVIMKFLGLIAALAWSCICIVGAEGPGKLKVLVVTGGHGFEEKEFFEAFEANKGIAFTHAEHSKGTSDVYDRPDLYSYDVVVLYDMVQKITDEQKAKFKGLFERGIGLVVMHHALASYQPSWPEFERIIGGTYPEPADQRGKVTEKFGYEHDVDVPVKIVAKEHPITAGLSDFELNDEIYWGFRTSADVTPLITTTHPKSGKPLAWARTEGKSRVAYIQLGHGPSAFKNENFRKMVGNAIGWAGKGD
jgi:type 1 glutamine amidotransferase